MSSQHVGHQHNHTHGMAKQTLRLAFFLTIIILAAELIGGFFGNFLALLSDAGPVVTATFLLCFSWFSTVQAVKAAHAPQTICYHPGGLLAALGNALPLIVTS